MSEIGGGAGTSFPGALDTDSTIEVNSPNVNKTRARAEVINDIVAALIAIQRELGTDPAGTLTDVKTFLQTEHLTNGRHVGPVNVENYASFAAAVTAIASTETTLLINTNQTVSSAVTVPSTLHVKVQGAGKFTKSGSGSITFNGPFDAPLRQVFSGFSAGGASAAGDVVFYSPLEIHPEWWGAVGDAGVYFSIGAMTSGSAVLTMPTANITQFFTSADVGKSISVTGAGAAGAVLQSTIAGFTDATTITLSHSAGTTVTTGHIYYGTDDTSAVQSAFSAVPNSIVSGVIKISSRQVHALTSAITLPSGGRIEIQGSVNGIGSALASGFMQLNPNADAIDAATYFTDVFGVYGLAFYGTGAGTGTGSGIRIGNPSITAYDSSIEKSWFINQPVAGLRFVKTYNVKAIYNTFEGGTYGIYVDDAELGSADLNTFSGSPPTGIYINKAVGFKINGNTFSLHGDANDTTGGIVIATATGESRNISITSNTFDNGQNDIVLIGSGSAAAETGINSILIAGNISNNAKRRSILLASASLTTIVGNRINDASQAASDTYPAIDIAGSSDSNYVIGNTVTVQKATSHQYGLQLGGSSTNTYLSGNSFAGLSAAENLGTSFAFLTAGAPVTATASLPAAAAGNNGKVIIEDAGAGDRNLIIYAGGQRFRIDGGTAF